MTAKGLTTHNKELFHKWLLKNQKRLDILPESKVVSDFESIEKDTMTANEWDKMTATDYRCRYNDYITTNELQEIHLHWQNGDLRLLYCTKTEDELIEMFLEEQEEEEE